MGGFDKDSINYGLLFSLTMEEATGTAITGDVAKPHHTTTLTHSPVWTVLPSGVWVMDFDGANDFLSLPLASAADLNFTTESFTISCWLNKNNVANIRQAIQFGIPTSRGYLLGINETQLYCTCGNGTTMQGGNVPVSTWCLVIITRIGTVSKSYINGIYITGNTDTPASIAPSLTDFKVGGFYSATFNYWSGQLWNPRIWNRALSPEEIKYMFERERWMFRI